MTNKQRKFFKHAKAASEMSSFPKVHIGAIVTYGSKVVGVGFNSRKSSPIQKKYNIERGYDPNVKNNGQIHAEMMCLINTKYLEVDWSKVSLYIYREHKDHTTALAKPCPACEKAIKERGIKQVYFTTEGIPYKKISYKK